MIANVFNAYTNVGTATASYTHTHTISKTESWNMQMMLPSASHLSLYANVYRFDIVRTSESVQKQKQKS